MQSFECLHWHFSSTAYILDLYTYTVGITCGWCFAGTGKLHGFDRADRKNRRTRKQVCNSRLGDASCNYWRSWAERYEADLARKYRPYIEVLLRAAKANQGHAGTSLHAAGSRSLLSFLMKMGQTVAQCQAGFRRSCHRNSSTLVSITTG